MNLQQAPRKGSSFLRQDDSPHQTQFASLPSFREFDVMKVSVSGRQFVFPNHCSCCGAFATTVLDVSGREVNSRSRTRGWTWGVPICATCKKHVKAYDTTLVSLFVLAALSVMGSLALDVWVGRSAALVALASGSITLLVSYLLLRRLIGRSTTENCSGLGRSVIYLGASGPCHSFDIRSQFYFADFVRSNHRKLVNASLGVRSVLRNTGFGEHQVPRRIIRHR